MKSKLGISVALTIIFVGSIAVAQGPRDQFNEMPSGVDKVDKRAVVEGIAEEQGIDMSTREGKRMMAQYLQESGQENLLPPRHKRRRGNQAQQGGGGENCDKGNQSQRGGAQSPQGPPPREPNS